MRGDPFVSMTGRPAFERAALTFSIALLLIAKGPGRFSPGSRFLDAPRSGVQSILEADFDDESDPMVGRF